MKTLLDMLNEARSASELKTSILPAGVYEIEITKADLNAELPFDRGEITAGTKCIAIFFRPTAPVEDIDEAELEACQDWKSKVLSIYYVGAEDLSKFADGENEKGLVYQCGLDMNDYYTAEGFDADALASDLKGCTVMGIVTHSPNKKDESAPPYVNLKRTASLTDA